ncbi:hypothetical protein L6452_40685 [Arctium lappa]|uniref:Uncharacterized protein n=1 Tax=Arctium lappa TaxID=4217 RepID=A0ACB8XMU6_ARCLA|nr:hypothetical protein L6452_40685 [Arctium lappa]
MIMLTKAFQKKFYKKPSSNSQRYSSGSRNYAHKEKVEGKRIEEKKSDEKPKPKVRNSEYYKNKMLLEKLQEAGKALMAEDKYWLDQSDEEEKNEETTYFCLMGKILDEAGDEAESDDEDYEEVCDMTESYFLNQMHAMMTKIQELESKLKREKGVIKDKNQSIQKLSNDVAEKNVLIEALHKNIDTSTKEKTIIHKELSETVSKYRLCEFESKELNKMYSSLSKENKSLLDKVNALEGKLYTLGQTKQTIHLNKPKENKECWGHGYENPHYLKKGISEVPALYDFGFFKLAPQYPELHVEWTKLYKEDEAKELEKTKNTTKIQLSFRYESYSSKELEAKPIEGKVYVSPLVLESKISELENTLTEERILIDLEQTMFFTVLKIFDFSNVSKASNFDDMSSLLNDGFDFLNYDGDLDECMAQFDFNSKLPDHSSFVINSFGLPSAYENGETSTKVDKSVPVKTKVAKGKKKKSGHSQKPIITDVKKKRHGVKSE